jgi:hypothetical protein
MLAGAAITDPKRNQLTTKLHHFSSTHALSDKEGKHGTEETTDFVTGRNGSLDGTGMNVIRIRFQGLQISCCSEILHVGMVDSHQASLVGCAVPGTPVTDG